MSSIWQLKINYSQMKLLSDIMYKAGIEEVIGTTNVAISDISFDSRNVKKDGLFIAVDGTSVDGHEYIGKAIEGGVIAIVCNKLPKKAVPNITYVRVNDSAVALGFIASNYYDLPSEKLTLVGVTGTNGKTTVATLLFNLFNGMGFKTGLLSTVVNKINNKEVGATHTTPDAIQLNSLLREMVDQKCTHCFMEVSSHAIDQERIAGLQFAGALFTNITHDHLDYHKTFDAYIIAKKKFFDRLSSSAFALVNRDDRHGKVMLQNTSALKKTFSLHSVADFKCKILESMFTGLLLSLDGDEVWTKLIGPFNAYNLHMVYATAMLLNQDKMNVLTTLSNLEAVEGRFDCLKLTNGVMAIIDYAHTPDAVLKVLETINEVRPGKEDLITVIGCGGDRDAAKRPEMARIASEKSDTVIFTSDNPRSEDPEKIIKDMLEGVEPARQQKILSIEDRKEAIKTACAIAKANDIILVVGKGHEKFQEIKGKKLPFQVCNVIGNNNN